MMDLLDAHVPCHNELSLLNLSEVQAKLFPSSVVFVDLHWDIVHLHNVKEMSGQLHKQLQRTNPALPERDSIKLKLILDECDGTAHVMSCLQAGERICSHLATNNCFRMSWGSLVLTWKPIQIREDQRNDLKSSSGLKKGIMTQRISCQFIHFHVSTVISFLLLNKPKRASAYL